MIPITSNSSKENARLVDERYSSTMTIGFNNLAGYYWHFNATDLNDIKIRAY